MRIKFKSPDPRAGMEVQMDSSRGQHFIDTGAADLVKENAPKADVPAQAAPAGPVESAASEGAAPAAPAKKGKK